MFLSNQIYFYFSEILFSSLESKKIYLRIEWREKKAFYFWIDGSINSKPETSTKIYLTLFFNLKSKI